MLAVALDSWSPKRSTSLLSMMIASWQNIQLGKISMLFTNTFPILHHHRHRSILIHYTILSGLVLTLFEAIRSATVAVHQQLYHTACGWIFLTTTHQRRWWNPWIDNSDTSMRCKLFQKEFCILCAVWTSHLTVSLSAQLCTLDWWATDNLLVGTMICGLDGAQRLYAIT